MSRVWNVKGVSFSAGVDANETVRHVQLATEEGATPAVRVALPGDITLGSTTIGELLASRRDPDSVQEVGWEDRELVDLYWYVGPEGTHLLRCGIDVIVGTAEPADYPTS